MISRIVYFDEVVEGIKDATGIENAAPLHDKIRRFIFKAEEGLGAGGLIVRKKKTYIKGDGYYDGKTILMPADFVGEFSYGDLGLGNFVGDRLELYCDGPQELDLRYMGFLLDDNNNPVTTGNHLDAVVAYAVYRMYSARIFLKTGNANIYKMFRQEWYDAVGEARGKDVFPTEEQWIGIGKTMNGGAYEAFTDCGMRGFPVGCNDPMFVDKTADQDQVCVYTAQMQGTVYAHAETSGVLSFTARGLLVGASNSVCPATANLSAFQSGEFALAGVSNGVATVTGAILQQIIVIDCDESFAYNGAKGTYSFEIEFGALTGMCGITFNSYSIPDRFRIEWNGNEVANSKFVGGTFYEQALLDLGYDPSELDLTGVGGGTLLFDKTSPGPSKATIHVDAPLDGTAWTIAGVCPVP